MECTCGGVLVEGKSCYSASGEDFYVVLENIPAFQCMRCGKVLFSEEVASRIQKLVKRMERESREIATGAPSIHSYDY